MHVCVLFDGDTLTGSAVTTHCPSGTYEAACLATSCPMTCDTNVALDTGLGLYSVLAMSSPDSFNSGVTVACFYESATV